MRGIRGMTHSLCYVENCFLPYWLNYILIKRKNRGHSMVKTVINAVNKGLGVI